METEFIITGNGLAMLRSAFISTIFLLTNTLN